MATRILYAVWSALPALLVLTAQHRVVFEVLGALPELAVASLTGLFNLAWYEIAYVLGTGLKRPVVYEVVPWIGGAAGLLPLLALVKPAWSRHLVRICAAVALAFGGLALLLLAWRGVRGFGDPWRLAATIAFVGTHAVWALSTFSWRRAPAEEPGLVLGA